MAGVVADRGGVGSALGVAEKGGLKGVAGVRIAGY